MPAKKAVTRPQTPRVDTTHPEYDAALPDWVIMRDVLEGERTVKTKGTAYLPKLSAQDDASYHAYVNRAQFFNATSRTLESLRGFIFRKDPVQQFTPNLQPVMDDATMSGLSFYNYCKHTVREVLGVGRMGTLVDFADIDNRPYLCAYGAESVINWRVQRVAGRMLLVLLVLEEESGEYVPADGAEPRDEYSNDTVTQWRVYRLLADDAGRYFVQCTVYRKVEGKADPEFIIVEQKIPTRRGIPLERIPFVFHGPNNSQPCVDKIPLLDMANVNLSLYRTSADLENGRHYAGIPTPWAAGFTTKDDVLKLGATVAWIADDPQAKCGFLEFNGEGLGALEKAVEQKKGEMAALGAKMLEPEAKKAEAFDTVAIRQAAESSALMNVTLACSQSLSAVLRWCAWWMGSAERPEDLEEIVEVELNTEFSITRLPPETITALVNAYVGNSIDIETLFYNLQQGEVIPPNRTIEEFRQSIEDNPQGLLAMPEPEPTGDPTGGA